MSGYYPLYVGAAYPASGGGGSGDMILASVQTVTGAKTFNDSTLLLANVAGTFSSKFTNTNTAARTYTLPDATGTVALISDLSSYATSTHVHGNITNAGAIGSTANLPLITTTSGVVTVGTFGTSANSFCQGNDSRLSDARTPVAHSTDLLTSGTLPVARGGTGLTALGTSLQVLRTNAGATALEYATLSTGSGDALVANPLSQFAATTSAQLAGVISDETGSGVLVFATSPTLVTPNIGAATGTSLKLGNATNGPTITTSGTSPNEAMVFTPGGGSGAQFVKNGVTPLSGNGVPQGDIATFRGAANRNWRIYNTVTGILTDTLNDSITGYGSWGLNAIDIELNSAGGGKVKIGGGTGITKVLSATATLDFPSIASNDTHTLTMTVTGAVAGNAVFIGVPAALDATLMCFASVTAADTVTIRVHNASGASVDPASGTYRATVFQF